MWAMGGWLKKGVECTQHCPDSADKVWSYVMDDMYQGDSSCSSLNRATGENKHRVGHEEAEMMAGDVPASY